jgi:hypothetical protein
MSRRPPSAIAVSALVNERGALRQIGPPVGDDEVAVELPLTQDESQRGECTRRDLDVVDAHHGIEVTVESCRLTEERIDILRRTQYRTPVPERDRTTTSSACIISIADYAPWASATRHAGAGLVCLWTRESIRRRITAV